MRWFIKLLVVLFLPIFVYGCVTTTYDQYGIKESDGSGMIVPDQTPPVRHYRQRQTPPPAQPHIPASHQAPSSAPQAPASAYGQVQYVNASKPGPSVVVLPGQIKTTNPEFSRLFSDNNIADFAELELTRANFNTLERDDLGPLLDEIKLAVTLGDPEALKKFKRGKFKSTKWFIKFDILRAEMVSRRQQGFNAGALGALTGSLIGGGAGRATAIGTGSLDQYETSGTWIVGLRYKIMDANTTEQKAMNYIERQMEVGAQSSSFLGFSQSQESIMSLDKVIQSLLQQAVYEIDMKYK